MTRSTVQALLAVPVVGMFLSSCSSAQQEERIQASEFGNEWPFTVNAITLRCGDSARRAVVFEANGTFYALNGTARGSQKVRDGVWKDSDQVRKIDPEKKARPDLYDRPFTNLPDSFIERGLKLCDAARR